MKITKARFLSQILSFIVLNLGYISAFKTGILCPVLYCYSCPLSAFACPIGTLQRFAIMSTVPFYSIGQLSLYSISLGRTYCGWACPFGSFQDIMSRIGLNLKRKIKNISELKFVILILILFLAYSLGDTCFCRFCPSASLFASLPFAIINPELIRNLYFWIHMSTLIIFSLAAILVERFWCRYLCPMGAITGALNGLSIIGISRDSSRCDNCGLCLMECPMGINRLGDMGFSTDCVRCGKCIEACPKNVLRFHFLYNMKDKQN